MQWREDNGRFTDVSARSGVAAVTNRYAMTATATDFDGDGWPDIYVACDTTASILYRNNHDGTFSDTVPGSGGPAIYRTATTVLKHTKRFPSFGLPQAVG